MTSRLDQNSDARSAKRNDTLVGAIVTNASRKLSMRCLIVNVSTDGAELHLTGDDRVPPQFELQVPQNGVVYRCDVRWREPGRIGVAFLGFEKINKKLPTLRLIKG
jgi:hypothetical protein